MTGKEDHADWSISWMLLYFFNLNNNKMDEFSKVCELIQDSLFELDAAAVKKLVDELNAIDCDYNEMTDNQWERYNKYAHHVVEPYDICELEKYGLDWDSMSIIEDLIGADGNLSEAFYKHGILCDQIDPAIHELVKLVDKIGY